MDYKKAYKKALALPKDSNTPIYQDFKGNAIKNRNFTIHYGEKEPTASSAFKSLHWGRPAGKGHHKKGYLYIVESKKDEKGNILPKKVYRSILFYHKKYARTDFEVPETIKYKIVGLKRATTHLPAAVLIDEIVFNTPD